MHRLLLLTLLSLITVSIYALNPSRTYNRLPEDVGISYDSVKIFSPDGYEINTWLMQPKTAEVKPTTVLLVGSDAGNMADLLPYAVQLLARGYPVVTFDYRGFGDSSNFAIDNDYVYYREFIDDYVTVADWLKTERSLERLAVMGFSMGTLVAAAGYERSGFDVFIGDSVVLSPSAVLARIRAGGSQDTFLPAHASLDENCLLEIPVPMLLFAAIADPITTLSDCRRVEAVNDRCRVTPHEGGHLGAVAALGLQTYVDQVVAVL